jgi:hypothetical protein
VVDWKVTVITIYCDLVDADVPIIVYKDGATKCVGYKKYFEGLTEDIAKLLKRKGKKLNKELRCEGSECMKVIAYRNKLFGEKRVGN